MSYLSRLARPLLLIATLPACYHATIETGASPSAEVVEKSFASGWIYGLVPPSTVSTAARCPNGPAKVETQLTFVNGLVRILTLGIYTPMAIKVTCAAPKSDSAIHQSPADASPTSARSATSQPWVKRAGADDHQRIAGSAREAQWAIAPVVLVVR